MSRAWAGDIHSREQLSHSWRQTLHSDSNVRRSTRGDRRLPASVSETGSTDGEHAHTGERSIEPGSRSRRILSPWMRREPDSAVAAVAGRGLGNSYHGTGAYRQMVKPRR